MEANRAKRGKKPSWDGPPIDYVLIIAAITMVALYAGKLLVGLVF